MTTSRWTGRYREQWTYRWAEQVPVRAETKSLRVNWCEITIVREDTGQQLYHNAWITSHKLTPKSVPEIVAAGRAHWKVENENFNMLKNQGYNFEHNYGHGKQHLSSVLLTLLLLAFLVHTMLHLSSLVVVMWHLPKPGAPAIIGQFGTGRTADIPGKSISPCRAGCDQQPATSL